MKYLIAALLSLVTIGVIDPACAGKLAVTIDGLKMTNGMLLVAATREAARDGKDKPMSVRVTATATTRGSGANAASAK